MKKAFIVAVLACLLITPMGCCSYTSTDGTVTKSFTNCFKTAQDKICNPPASVVAIAQAAAPLIPVIIGMLAPGSAEMLAAVDAAAAVNAILTGSCVAVTQINNLIALLKSSKAQAAQVKIATKVKAMPAKAIDVQPLIDWRDGVKK